MILNYDRNIYIFNLLYHQMQQISKSCWQYLIRENLVDLLLYYTSLLTQIMLKLKLQLESLIPINHIMPALKLLYKLYQLEFIFLTFNSNYLYY
jgi:hypothetical protein